MWHEAWLDSTDFAEVTENSQAYVTSAHAPFSASLLLNLRSYFLLHPDFELGKPMYIEQPLLNTVLNRFNESLRRDM